MSAALTREQVFVSGVVEGFYGRPWTSNQRIELFKRLDNLGLNAYVYAPKDDAKHRQLWRIPYCNVETVQLKRLIVSAISCNVEFVYAISPGIDITFSDSQDVYLLKQKMLQVSELGCQSFALLFDDIDPNLSEIDLKTFSSSAEAQASLTNLIYDFLKRPKLFFFCPTEYCGNRARPSVKESDYLKTIGETLLPDVRILWTGPKVVSKFISASSIMEVSDVIRRFPVIWDNIHANDYDQKRLFLGPYCGRSSGLIPYISGVLTNPNCEFEANYVAMHTLAQWTRSHQEAPITTDIHCSITVDEYEPSDALKLALLDWHKILYEPKTDSFLDMNDCCKTTSKDVQVPDSIEPSLKTVVTSSPTFKSEKLQNDTVEISTSSDTGGGHSNMLSPSSFNVSTTDVDELNKTLQNVYECDNKSDQSSVALDVSNSDGAADDEGDSNHENHHSNSRVHKDSNVYYEFKSCFIDSSRTDEDHLNESNPVSTKVESMCDSHSNNTDINMDNVFNIFPLIPMETEENQNDVDSNVDSMIMQVDAAYDGSCEIMDIVEIHHGSTDNLKETECSDSKCPASMKSNKQLNNTSESQLTLDDLTFLVHLFFLPYEHGCLTVKLLELVYWLRCHAYLVNKNVRFPEQNYCPCSSQYFNLRELDDKTFDKNFKVLQWHAKAKEFYNEVDRIRNIIDKFCNIPNRLVLFDLYPYVHDMRHVLGTLKSYIMWLGCSPGYKESFMIDDHEPWMFRGGLISEFQRMFPLEGSCDLFPNQTSFQKHSSKCRLYNLNRFADYSIPKTYQSHYTVGIQCSPVKSPIYTIRPFCKTDRNALYRLCCDTLCLHLKNAKEINEDDLKELNSAIPQDLPGDRYLGHFLDFSPETCIILDSDNGEILGYAVGTPKINEYIKFRKTKYDEVAKEKYFSNKCHTSVVQILHEGLSNTEFYSQLENIDNNKPSALIHMNLKDCLKESDLDTVDGLCQKLFKSFCSILKSQISDKPHARNRQHALLENSNFSVAEDDGDNDDDDKINFIVDRDSYCSSYHDKCSDYSMIIYSEIDSLSKRHQEFYQRCGFNKVCLKNDDTDYRCLMSRFVS